MSTYFLEIKKDGENILSTRHNFKSNLLSDILNHLPSINSKIDTFSINIKNVKRNANTDEVQP